MKPRLERARLGLGLGIASLFLWPLSYAWVPTAGHNPAWIAVLVPVAELGAFGSAIAAILLGVSARRSGLASPGATWAPRLGALTLVLMVLAVFVFAALYR